MCKALHTDFKKGKGLQLQAFDLIGGQGRNRTIDTRIFSPLLYQLSYLAFEKRAIIPARAISVKESSPPAVCRRASEPLLATQCAVALAARMPVFWRT